MGLLDGFRWLVGREQHVEERQADDSDSLADLLARRRGVVERIWRPASTRSAMGVPAVFKAVSLIANTVGSLSLEAFRDGAKLPNDQTPRLLLRPDPFNQPHVFWRDSAYYRARSGETWWWIAKRDIDDLAMSLLCIDPREITVEKNTRNPFRPIIKWLGEEMRNEDMVQTMYLRDDENPLRGVGPLQRCGAAVSVAVEAQDWAANFFSGNPSNTWIKSALDINDAEALELKTGWIKDSGNLPKVTGPAVEDVRDIGVEPEKAQMSEVRQFQNGEVSLMFSIPPTLLNHGVAGSSITYQNIGQVADDFLRTCLLPHYLEPFEQTISDLLSRSTIARFNVEGLRRADIATRYNTYNVGIPLGVITPEEARSAEGFAAGDVENRPVPFAPPQAVPASLPIRERSEGSPLRCQKCGKMLLNHAAPGSWGTCSRCKTRTDAIGTPRAPMLRIVRADDGSVTVQETA